MKNNNRLFFLFLSFSSFFFSSFLVLGQIKGCNKIPHQFGPKSEKQRKKEKNRERESVWDAFFLFSALSLSSIFPSIWRRPNFLIPRERKSTALPILPPLIPPIFLISPFPFSHRLGSKSRSSLCDGLYFFFFLFFNFSFFYFLFISDQSFWGLGLIFLVLHKISLWAVVVCVCLCYGASSWRQVSARPEDR